MVNELCINKIIKEDVDNIVNSELPWEKFRNKTILISGASGLLASYLVYTLLNLNDKKDINCKVIGVVRNIEKAKKRFGDNYYRNDLIFIESDISYFSNIEEKVDYIIHAASQASPIYYKVDPVGTINANVLGTNNLLHIAKKNNIEGFLYFSSSEVYGQVSNDDGYIYENNFGYLDPTNVRSCYAESKRLGETMCISWNTQYGIPIKIVRPFHTYGPGIDFNDGRVFSDFVANVVNYNDIVIKSDGSAKRAFCYIEDAVKGFFTVLLLGKNGEAYNIGNDEGEVSIKNLANILCETFSDRKIKLVIDCPSDNNYMKSPVKGIKPNIEKAKKLGWKPQYSVKEGFYRTIISYD